MRRNGFQRPFHPLQVLSWFVFSFLILSYHLFLLPSLSSTSSQIGLTLGYWMIAGLMISFGFRMTRSEPLDQIIREAREERSKKMTLRKDGKPIPTVYDYPLDNETQHQIEIRRLDPQVQLRISQTGENRNWCPYCIEHVHPTSKHCRLCDKCVSDFDHHCKWLNTCVGGRNYHLFFLAMTFALLLLAYQCGLSLFLFLSTFLDNYDGESAVTYLQDSYGSGFEKGGFQTVLILNLVLTTPLFLSLGQLFGLHVYLWKRKITTYEWIMERRAELQAKEAANADAAEAAAQAQKAQQQQQQQQQQQPTVQMVTIKHHADHEHTTPGEYETPTGDDSIAHAQYDADLQSQYLTPGNPADDPAHRDGHPYFHPPRPSSHARDGSLLPRTMTVTAAEVRLVSNRPTSASMLAASPPSRTPTNMAGSHVGRTVFIHTHEREHEPSRSYSPPLEAVNNMNPTPQPTEPAGGQTYGRHQVQASRSRPTSAVTMHIPRASFSRTDSFASTLVNGGVGVDGSNTGGASAASTAAGATAPSGSSRGSGRYTLPPITREPSPTIHTNTTNANTLATHTPIKRAELPGSVASELSPHGKSMMGLGSNNLTSPSGGTPGLPLTPTASHTFGSSSTHVDSSMPPPPLPLVNSSNSTTMILNRTLEDEANEFLQDPHATEPQFQTQSQRNRKQ